MRWSLKEIATNTGPLERQGYTREELSQTLEFIEAETGLSGDKE